MPEISVLIEGGKATAAAPLGPALGPLGVNIGEIVAKINEKTRTYSGMKVPVKINIDSATKKYEISVGSPPTSALICKEAGIEKGTANPKSAFVGNLTMAQVRKIAESKMEYLGGKTIKAASKEIIGSCDAMGVTVEGKRAKETMKDVAAGNYDEMLSE